MIPRKVIITMEVETDDYGTLETAYKELKKENEALIKECENYQQMIDAEPQERP
jgi:hypothetical protein